MANLPPASLTPVKKIAAGGIVINVNHVKSIITGVVDMHRGSLSMMPAVNLPLVSRMPALHIKGTVLQDRFRKC